MACLPGPFSRREAVQRGASGQVALPLSRLGTFNIVSVRKAPLVSSIVYVPNYESPRRHSKHNSYSP